MLCAAVRLNCAPFSVFHLVNISRHATPLSCPHHHNWQLPVYMKPHVPRFTLEKDGGEDNLRHGKQTPGVRCRGLKKIKHWLLWGSCHVKTIIFILLLWVVQMFWFASSEAQVGKPISGLLHEQRNCCLISSTWSPVSQGTDIIRQIYKHMNPTDMLIHHLIGNS